jgi:hypothetical protein
MTHASPGRTVSRSWSHPCSRNFLQLVNICTAFVGRELQSDTDPHPKPDKSNPLPHSAFIKSHFNTILSPTTSLPKWTNRIKILYAFVVPSLFMLRAPPILLDVLLILSKEYKLCLSTLRNFPIPPCHYLRFGSKYFHLGPAPQTSSTHVCETKFHTHMQHPHYVTVM